MQPPLGPRGHGAVQNYPTNPQSCFRVPTDGALPYVINVPDTQDEPSLRLQMMTLGAMLADLPYPLCVGGNDRRAVATMLGPDRPNVTVPVGRTSNQERIDAWKEAFERRGWDLENAQAIAERFYSIGGTTVARVCTRAAPSLETVSPMSTLWSAARSGRPIFRLAQRTFPVWLGRLDPEFWANQTPHTTAQQETVMNRWGVKIGPWLRH